MTDPRSPLHLLEPGALLGGALFGSLIDQVSRGDRLPPGTRLGPFRVEDELGRGGMGVVYRAERDDGEYRQAVAIKSLSSSGSAQGLELFRRERQVLAELRHPHIARLLDGGHHADGRLWFAMELIDGQPIDAHAHAAALPVAARLALMRQVIDAVAFAHQRLLIHRDIKPGNVLVDADGSVKLLDFGIAALVGDVAAARAYSPAWASPEQRADEEVGPASDQFQLGLLLDAVLRTDAAAELRDNATLVRATAVIGETGLAGHAAGINSARTVEPARWIAMPSSRRAELVAIVARATARAADTRYGSVAELGAEIDRWLGLRPVAAYSGGIAYTTRCGVRRHPVIATIAATTVIAVAALVAGFNLRVSQERDLARVAAARAEREAATARAINRFLNEDLLAAADPYGANLKDAPIGDIIERAVPRVADRLGSQPAVAGEVYRTLGDMLGNLGRTQPARATLDRAVELLTQAHGPLDARVVEARILRAGIEEFAADYTTYERMLGAIRKQLDGIDPQDRRVIEVDRRLAWAAFELGAYDRAELAYRDLLARSAGNPVVTEVDLATMHGGLSLVLLRLRRYPEAHASAHAGLAIRTRELGPDDPGTLQSQLHVANALVGLERLEEAIPVYRRLVEAAYQRFGPMHTESVVLAHELGAALVRSAHPDEAILHLERAVAGKVEAMGQDAGSTTNSLAWLGLAYVRAGRLGDAEAAFARARAFKPATDFDRRAYVSLLRNIGELRLAQGRPADALVRCRQGAAIAKADLEPSHPLRVGVEACIGVALATSGHAAEGREMLAGLRGPLGAAGSQTSEWAAKAAAILDEGRLE